MIVHPRGAHFVSLHGTATHARPEQASARLNVLKVDELEAAIKSLDTAAKACL